MKWADLLPPEVPYTLWWWPITLADQDIPVPNVRLFVSLDEAILFGKTMVARGSSWAKVFQGSEYAELWHS